MEFADTAPDSRTWSPGATLIPVTMSASGALLGRFLVQGARPARQFLVPVDNRPPLRTLWNDPVQNLAVANHAESFTRGPLLRCGIGLERAREALERIHFNLQLRDRSAFFRHLPPQREPVERAVLAGQQRERRQCQQAERGHDASARHNPYMWRPG